MQRADNILSQLLFYLVLIITFLIPFGWSNITYGLGLLALFSVAKIIIHPPKWERWDFVRLFVLWIPVIISFISLIYTQHLDRGVFLLQVQLALLLFPVVGYALKAYVRKQDVEIILVVFAIATIITMFIAYLNAFFNSLENGPEGFYFSLYPEGQWWRNYFFYDLFSNLHHPTYFSILQTASLLILLSSPFLKRLKWKIILILFFLITAYFTASRTGFVVTVIIIISAVLSKYKPAFLFKMGTVSIVFSFILFAGFFVQINDINMSGKGGEYKLFDRGVGERFYLWKAANHLSKECVLFGYGVGDVQKELKKEVHEGHSSLELETPAGNTHNQYIEYLLGSGLIGLICFLFVIGYLLICSLKKQNLLLFGIVITFYLHFIFETLLNRFTGVISFAFLISMAVLLVCVRETNDTSSHSSLNQDK